MLVARNISHCFRMFASVLLIHKLFFLITMAKFQPDFHNVLYAHDNYTHPVNDTLKSKPAYNKQLGSNVSNYSTSHSIAPSTSNPSEALSTPNTNEIPKGHIKSDAETADLLSGSDYRLPKTTLSTSGDLDRTTLSRQTSPGPSVDLLLDRATNPGFEAPLIISTSKANLLSSKERISHNTFSGERASEASEPASEVETEYGMEHETTGLQHFNLDLMLPLSKNRRWRSGGSLPSTEPHNAPRTSESPASLTVQFGEDSTPQHSLRGIEAASNLPEIGASDEFLPKASTFSSSVVSPPTETLYPDLPKDSASGVTPSAQGQTDVSESAVPEIFSLVPQWPENVDPGSQTPPVTAEDLLTRETPLGTPLGTLPCTEGMIIEITGFTVECTSPTSGYLRKDSERDSKPKITIRSVDITLPPSADILMISFPVAKVSKDDRRGQNMLSLRTDSTSRWSYRGHSWHPPTAAYRARQFALELNDLDEYLYNFSAELIARFSFHNESAAPVLFLNDTWDCSLPHRADFLPHLRCNLVRECVGGEDEVDCDYHRPLGACAGGRIPLHGRCYGYIQPPRALSWDEASDLCQGQGGQLVSLNTPGEWRDVSRLLARGNFNGIFLGLSGRDPVLLNSYRHILTWADGSIAYFRYLKSGHSGLYYYLLQDGYDPATEAYRAEANDSSLSLSYVSAALPGALVANDSSGRHLVAHTLTYPLVTVNRTLNVLCEFGDATRPNRSSFSSTSTSTSAAAATTASRGPPVGFPSFNATGDGAAYPVPVVRCPRGHVTRDFLACDASAACWSSGYGDQFSCDAPLSPPPPSFLCGNGAQRVSFTLVCDFRSDCSDDSDEALCVFPPTCDRVGMMACGNHQCVRFSQRCDGVEDCTNGADELWCQAQHQQSSTPPPPATVYLDGKGSFTVLPHSSPDVTSCPPDAFHCRGGSGEKADAYSYYCLPVYARCNGLHDCPGREDESGCETYTCPGLYRCWGSRICLHPNFLCDGLQQCPGHDDELLCNQVRVAGGSRCPAGCTCYGWTAYCRQATRAASLLHELPELRFLEASGSGGWSLAALFNHSMLVHVGLSRCGLRDVSCPQNLPNVRYLDLSDNLLAAVELRELEKLPNLQELVLDGNPLVADFFEDAGQASPILSVRVLRLSTVTLRQFRTSVLRNFPNLQQLNMSQCRMEETSEEGLGMLQDLEVVDLRGCPLTTFPRDFLRDNAKLHTVYSDNYKLCCATVLPEDFHFAQCHAPTDEISSCEALLRSDAYRAILVVFAVLSLFGNLGSFAYRVIISKARSHRAYGVFVTHLSVANFLMGVYLAVIGVADRVYLGGYLWQEVAWRRSATCRLAGFLSLVSSEVSSFLIVLITLDQVLRLRFPFSERVHFGQTSAHLACGAVWTVGVALAGVPFLPPLEEWHFHGQNGICIPLPVTRSEAPGYAYSFSLMTVLNMVLFFFIAVGQLLIYCTVRGSGSGIGSRTPADLSVSVRISGRPSSDLVIAQRLMTVAVSNFLCWFPVSLLGALSAAGTPVPGEVNVALAILVLPLNAALNPFLYTLNVVMKRRRRAAERRLQQMLRSFHDLNTRSKSNITAHAVRGDHAM